MNDNEVAVPEAGFDPSSAALRTAQTLVLSGEALRLRVTLVRLTPSDDAASQQGLASDDLMSELLDAGKRAVKSGLGKQFTVALERDQDALSYRVFAYHRPASGMFSAAGPKLESEILATLEKLAANVESTIGQALEPVVANARWFPGPGLHLDEEGDATDSAAELERRIRNLRNARQRARLVMIFSAIGAAATVVISVLLFITLSDDSEFISVIPVAYGLVLAAGVLFGRGRLREIDQDIEDARDQQDLGELIKDARERRAQKLFQVHSHQVKRYYDQALRQRGAAFVAGLLCIVAGFAVIGGAFVVIEGSTDTTEKIVAAGLGAIGGVLGNFIAVIYLRMFTETIRSIGAFHDRLVLTHYLHFANLMVARVDDDELRDETLSAVARAIAFHESTDNATGSHETDRVNRALDTHAED